MCVCVCVCVSYNIPVTENIPISVEIVAGFIL